jgi:hypothetical protein
VTPAGLALQSAELAVTPGGLALLRRAGRLRSAQLALLAVTPGGLALQSAELQSAGLAVDPRGPALQSAVGLARQVT